MSNDILLINVMYFGERESVYESKMQVALEIANRYFLLGNCFAFAVQAFDSNAL